MAAGTLRRKSNFIEQQGFEAPPPASCATTYSTLQFQPRAVAVVVVAGLLTQWWPLFAVLAAVLWWSALFPRWNPFDHLHNRIFARRLAPAPPPRRFAQTLAGAFALIIAVLIALGLTVAAVVIELVLLAAVAALVLGGFCLGSYVFHLLRGRRVFANRTLPWSSGD